MSDLPAPFALPEYAKPARPPGNKIKLKMAGGSQTSPSGSSPNGQQSIAQSSTSSSFTLRVPGGTESAKPTVASNVNIPTSSPHTGAAALPARQAQPAPAPVYTNQLPTAPMTSQTYSIQPIQATPRQPPPYQYTPQHYPNASYQPASNGIPPAGPSTVQVTTSAIPHIEAQSFTKSPSPSNHRPLKGVSLITKPRGRPIKLDYRDGVRSWAMKLGQGENALSVADVRFLGDVDEQGTDDEAHGPEEEEEEAEDAAPSNGKGKVKRGRGRPPKATTRPAAPPKAKVTRSSKPIVPKATTPLQDSVKVWLNGSLVQGNEDHAGTWDVDLRVGSNILEAGEEGGMTWKVYLERLSAF